MLPSFRPNGPTYRITVPSSASTPLEITPNTNVENNYVALINTGTASVVVSLGTTSGTTATPAVPATANSTPGVILPPAMNYPIVVPAPRNNFFVSIIGTAANGECFVTPLAAG
jgi:ABC-type molybdate transport system substrate-binding protein